MRTSRQSGFTLMESVYAILIIGLGVVALMQVFTAGTNVNDYGDGLSKAVFLANEIRSMTDYVNYEDLLLMDTGLLTASMPTARRWPACRTSSSSSLSSRSIPTI